MHGQAGLCGRKGVFHPIWPSPPDLRNNCAGTGAADACVDKPNLSAAGSFDLREAYALTAQDSQPAYRDHDGHMSGIPQRKCLFERTWLGVNHML